MSIYMQRTDVLAPLPDKLKQALEEYLDTLEGETKDHKVAIRDISFRTATAEDGALYRVTFSAIDIGIKKS